MLAQQRQQKILAIVSQQGGVRVSELSRDLGVAEMTIRRDLGLLEQQGRLVRTHGGAGRVDIITEPAFAEKADLLAGEKLRIAKAGAGMVQNGVVGLSAGTTTTAVAACLARDNNNLTVVTNALNIAWGLVDSHINIVLTGGSMRRASYALVGPGSQLDNLWLDILFLGANGVSIQEGVTTPNLAEAQTNASLLARARKVVVVADHSKLGRTALGQIAELRRVDMLLTSQGADPDFVKEAREMGLEVRLV
jgi:DeoR/GlpR family transcriptional regulator of sugar metabolism